MKLRLMMLVIIGYMFVAASCTVSGHVVAERPSDVYYERPVSPGVGYVWIDGDWVWTGGSYHWRGGHWMRPRGGRVWEGGRWESSGSGWRWHRGHWR